MKVIAGWFLVAAVAVSVSFAQSAQENERQDYKFKGAWKKGTVYTGSFEKRMGDTVTHGKDATGKDMYWWAKWWTDADEPGTLVDSGGTNPWAFINAANVKTTTQFKFQGASNASGGSLAALIPTYRDGAKGCYSIHHDDICAMPMKYVTASYEIANRYGIQIAWGAKVDQCDEDADWYIMMKKELLNGHEVTCHSYNHSSAADQWQWIMQDSLVPTKEQDESIPDEWIGGLKVVKSMSGGEEKTSSSGQKLKVDLTAKQILANSTQWISDADAKHPTLKLFCRAKWNTNDFTLNVDRAKDTLDMNVYKDFQGNKYFPKGKQTEFYIYPYDAYSVETHKYLDSHGFISARGGSKSGIVHRGDLFHPYLIDFDAYYLVNEDPNIVYPKNPHQLLSLEGMVDEILKNNGYMIREFHAVADKGADYWGAVPKNLYEAHMKRLRDLTDKNEIAVMTVSEAVKYFITRNSATAAKVEQKAGDDYLLTVTASGAAAKYQDEISVIVTFASATTDWDKMAVVYDGTTESPRWPPRKLEARKWSIPVNPYKNGGKILIKGGATAISKVNGTYVNKARYLGYANGALNLTLDAGSYSIALFNAAGKNVQVIKGITTGGTLRAPLDKSIAGGLYLMKVEHSYGSMMQPISIIR